MFNLFPLIRCLYCRKWIERWQGGCMYCLKPRKE